MKRVSILVLALALLAGQAQAASASTSLERKYVHSLRLLNGGADVKGMSDATLIATGRSLCASFKQGLDMQRFVNGVIAGNASTRTKNTIFAILPAAVTFLCPKYVPALRAIH